LHVEQGAFLDKENISIGVVRGIVGIRRWNITIDGFANHAGTTPMDQREDALYAAALLIAEVRRVITEVPGQQVGTVGSIQAFPGAPNVIAGQVKSTLEIRDLDMDKIETLFQRIRDSATAIAERTDTTIVFEQYYESPAAITDERIKSMIQDSADALGLSAMHMPSGAGHDAQSLAGIAPLGMIFVPSKDGCARRIYERAADYQRRECTPAVDCQNGPADRIDFSARLIRGIDLTTVNNRAQDRQVTYAVGVHRHRILADDGKVSKFSGFDRAG
jgi:hydantoinase/carbamoylase family amidase